MFEVRQIRGNTYYFEAFTNVGIYRLDEKYSTVLLFAFVHEYTPARIAKILGISRPAVYKRLNKGKVLLLESLKKKGGEYL